MPMMLESHDSLPYIDPQPTDAQLAAASALLASELPSDHTQTLHPSIPTIYTPSFSDLVNTGHSQIASSGTARDPDTGIDLSRYEEPSAPTTSSHDEWRSTLHSAFISHSYLTSRQLNLSLLERYGKNAWLIGNSQVEDELRVLEKELATTKRQVEEVEEERRQRQELVKGEMEGLEMSWRQTVGRAIEAEVAGEGLRREILERRRGGR